MNKPESNQLKIINLDPMGQGVAKKEGHVFFIPKTLPEEIVEYKTRQEKSKITFAELTTVIEQSHLRTKATCPHYDKCSGCHYQHTSYEEEIKFKEASLTHYLKSIPNLPKIQVTAASQRYHYRNRIQLHYQKGILGLHRAQSHEILEIPHCQLPHPAIQEKISELYDRKELFQGGQGHIEIFLDKSSQVKTEKNKPYASEGFSQVNAEMNLKLQEQVNHLCEKTKSEKVLELFCGDGNLSRLLDKKTQLIGFDSHLLERVEGARIYLKQNLYSADAVKNIQKECRKSNFKPQTLLLDPPRSGFKQLKELSELLRPEFIIYVSCAPDTLARDIKLIALDYDIQEIHLLDLFPATYHYETIVLLQKKASL